jgi:hypothetical protein
MVLCAAVAALALNWIANHIFMVVEASSLVDSEFAAIGEDEMQPDMPNLVKGLLLVGWAFFLTGFLVARARRANRATTM